MMRTDRLELGAVALGTALSLAGCGQDEGPLYEEQTLEKLTILPGTVLGVIDNGYLTDPYIEYCEYSPEGWYFISTPSAIDTVFPGARSLLESYFPEGGSLLCLDLLLESEDHLLGYSVGFAGDTVRVLAEINHYVGSGPYIPGFNEYFFPFGVILQSPARPER
ncbi:MAG: lipoprotein [Candidatus Fermentibacter sp.]|nr:lipoprotein [Candidatus Fermentibacter sp.]